MEIIDLSKNENPLGCSPMATHMATIALKHMHLYPCQEEFTRTVATLHDVPLEHIFVANGASEIMDILARTRLSAGNNAVTTKGSFAAYTTITQNTGAAINTPCAPEHACSLNDVDKTINGATKVVWLANPNNPTGSLLQADHILDLALQHPHATIVCDEAYIDYVENADTHSLLGKKQLPANVVVIRSFSKLHGIAGTRVGYAVTAPETVLALKKLQLPFSVSSVAIAAATGALQDTAFQELSRHTATQSRSLIESALSRLGIMHLPSVCNFVSFAHTHAQKLQQDLLQSGFMVRELTPFGMPGFLRVSTGTVPQTEQFIQTLQALMQK